MALKQGISDETVHHNIKELLGAGHSKKHAVAMALSTKRKYQKMADGGYVEGEEEVDSGEDSIKSVHGDGHIPNGPGLVSDEETDGANQDLEKSIAGSVKEKSLPSYELSPEQKAAIEDRKKKRRIF
jgi:hypothetical protein